MNLDSFDPNDYPERHRGIILKYWELARILLTDQTVDWVSRDNAVARLYESMCWAIQAADRSK